MGLTADSFPRPAFLSDLNRLLQQTNDVTILLFADVERAKLSECLNLWTKHIAAGKVVVACRNTSSHTRGEDNGSRQGSRFRFIDLPDWSGGGLPPKAVRILRDLRPKPDLILSCATYDPYGVHVKVELERSLIPLVKAWRSLYLIHDAQYEVLRVADYKALKDRLYRRPLRLRAYRALVWLVYAGIDLIARGGPAGWRLGKYEKRK